MILQSRFKASFVAVAMKDFRQQRTLCALFTHVFVTSPVFTPQETWSVDLGAPVPLAESSEPLPAWVSIGLWNYLRWRWGTARLYSSPKRAPWLWLQPFTPTHTWSLHSLINSYRHRHTHTDRQTHTHTQTNTHTEHARAHTHTPTPHTYR